MSKINDKNTRYFVDLDLQNLSVIGRGYDHRDKLVQTLPNPLHHRVFLTKGQYNKLERASVDIKSR